MFSIVLISFLGGLHALEIGTQTGTTPPPILCPNNLCNGRQDGNFEISNFPSYFVQCSFGSAHCQACWPLSLVFKQSCNQCMYSQEDVCYTTKSWEAQATYTCPDLCPRRDRLFRGNIADPNQQKHYIACWDGITVGCIRCPEPLLYNEPWNACLWDGLYHTQPSK